MNMILARIQEQQKSVVTIRHKQKTFARHRNAFRATNFSLCKRHTINYQPQTSPVAKQVHHSPDAKQECKSVSSDVMEKTCSNFMKSYVEKLKKQRKREKKRLNQVNQNRQTERQSMMGCDISPLPLIHHGKQQILIFQKMNPNSFKSAIINPTPSSSTIEHEKIQDILSEIKHHKETRHRDFSKKNSDGFPSLESRAAKARQLKMNSIGDLNPWEGQHDNNFQQFK